MTSRTYLEEFNDDPGGWLGWRSNARGAARLEVIDGAVVSRSPWWIDYNHAPPGAGYLQLLFILPTSEAAAAPPQFRELGGENRFVGGGFPNDFRNARISVRLKGEIDLRGAQLVLLIQSTVGAIRTNHVLIGQPLQITLEWSTQTLSLTPDPAQWICLGSRKDRQEFYGDSTIDEALRNVDVDIIFVLFPVNVVSASDVGDRMHELRAGEDYAVDGFKLPVGYVRLDQVQIDFPPTSNC